MATRYNYTGGIVTNGLVLNLDAAKTDSYPGTGTTWRDLSGNSNNGTLTNGPTFSGIGKQASIVFDGVDDFVSGSDIPFRFGNTFTLSAFIYFDGNNMDGVIMGKRNGNPFNQYSMNVSSGDPYSGGTGSFATFFGRPDETRNRDVVLNYQLLSAGVYNIVTTVNTNYQALYVNSIEVANNNRNYTSNTFTISGRDILIGAIRDNTGTGILSPFKNNIYSAQIYNRALSATEVTQNFNALRGRYGI
jgi:hypothetical protein